MILRRYLMCNHVFNLKFSDVKSFFNLKTNLGEKTIIKNLSELRAGPTRWSRRIDGMTCPV
jgi:hypothetical protein